MRQNEEVMAQKNLLHGFKCHSQGKPFGPVIGVTVGKNTVFLVTTSPVGSEIFPMASESPPAEFPRDGWGEGIFHRASWSFS